MPAIPDKWFDYSPYGSPIGDTRIIPVKTPLKQIFNNGRRKTAHVVTDNHHGVPLEEEFTPTQLVERLRDEGKTLGMVVDLTFTSRYYNPKEFHDHGVSHTKILCPGREIPSDEVYTKFATALQSFLRDRTNGNSLVAVHCTHGLNRTGYLVCRYLIDHCGYSVEDAIQAFNTARGYDIERENFLEHLRNGCPKLSSQGPRKSRSPRPPKSPIAYPNVRNSQYHKDVHAPHCEDKKPRNPRSPRSPITYPIASQHQKERHAPHSQDKRPRHRSRPHRHRSREHYREFDSSEGSGDFHPEWRHQQHMYPMPQGGYSREANTWRDREERERDYRAVYKGQSNKVTTPAPVHVLKKQAPIQSECQEANPPPATVGKEQVSQNILTQGSPPLQGCPYNKAAPESTQSPVPANLPQGDSLSVTYKARQLTVNKEEHLQRVSSYTHDGSLLLTSIENDVPTDDGPIFSWTWGWTTTTLSIAFITAIVCICYKFKYK